MDQQIQNLTKQFQNFYLKKIVQISPIKLKEVERRLIPYFQQVLIYEDWELQEKARNIMPVDTFHERAREKKDDQLGFEDLVVKELLSWFKNDFFKWVNELSCGNCSIKMKAIGMANPTSEDLMYGGKRVEVYQCTNCQMISRFPRYNHPGKLLETRKGRCGEWANCFGLCLRSLGFDTRFILDFTDHVWLEYYSDHLNKWIHLDPCENAFNSPLMYEAGWQKKLNYVFAISCDEIRDVILRYTKDFENVLKRRNLMSEIELLRCLIHLNQKISKQFPEKKKDFLKKRFENEIKQLSRDITVLQQQELQGRQSGSLEWRLARGETRSE